MDDDAKMPIVETYRGVGIHDFQPKSRIDMIVKPAIDAVFAISDPVKLSDYAGKSANPPEARLFAAARCEVVWELAAENREVRPNVDMRLLRASISGLSSLKWLSADRFTTLLDPYRHKAASRDHEHAELARAARR